MKIVLIGSGNVATHLGKALKADSIVLHTSGSVSINVFEKKFKTYGVFYPVQTFSVKHPITFKNIPVCIEANNPASKKKITSLAKSITKKIHYLDSDQRKKV